MPTSSQSRCLPATYAWLPGSVPTRMVPSPGRTPCARRARTRTARSSLIWPATRLPSILVAVVIGSLSGRYGSGVQLPAPAADEARLVHAEDRDRHVAALA